LSTLKQLTYKPMWKIASNFINSRFIGVSPSDSTEKLINEDKRD